MIVMVDYASPSVFESNREGAGSIRGIFRPGENVLVLQTDDGDPPEALPLDVQEVVVHELAHAWQRADRLDPLLALAEDDPFLARALIEGEAEWDRVPPTLLIGSEDDIRKGHPDHPERLESLAGGKVTVLPLRDPYTMQPIKE